MGTAEPFTTHSKKGLNPLDLSGRQVVSPTTRVRAGYGITCIGGTVTFAFPKPAILSEADIAYDAQGPGSAARRLGIDVIVRKNLLGSFAFGTRNFDPNSLSSTISRLSDSKTL